MWLTEGGGVREGHGQWRRYTRTHVSSYAVIGNGCSSLAAPLPLGRAALQLKVELLSSLGRWRCAPQG
uniref:Uncharacterized protein n=1 Tax=Knipowitschia caucasica TaxID=637954 RepID=A0AAV2K6Q7_KNICA